MIPDIVRNKIGWYLWEYKQKALCDEYKKNVLMYQFGITVYNHETEGIIRNYISYKGKLYNNRNLYSGHYNSIIRNHYKNIVSLLPTNY